MRRIKCPLRASIGTLLLVLAAAAPSVGAVRIFLVSRTAAADPGNDQSYEPALSPDGRTVGFSSKATNLIDPDENGAIRDVFVGGWSFAGCEIESRDWSGTQLQVESFISERALSVDGVLSVFISNGPLQDGDTNEVPDVYLRNRVRDTIELVSTRQDGDLANYGSLYPIVSPDGHYVCFSSTANNLVDGDINKKDDVFMKNVRTGDVDLISIASDGTQGNKHSNGRLATSADSRFVAFESDATNLVKDDTNDRQDIFVHDRHTKVTVRASVDDRGKEGYHGAGNGNLGGISADGRFVAFSSSAELTRDDATRTAPDVFLRDLLEKTTTLISTGNGGQTSAGAGQASISANGRYVAMASGAKFWDERNSGGVVQIFVRDLQSETMMLVSENDNDEVANDNCSSPQISANGRFVAFLSRASNLVEGDTHGVYQVYVRDFLGCDAFLRGDSNCDGAVDFGDIDPFVLALIDQGEYVLAHLSCDWQCNNDIDGDGNVDFNDIDGFVECLINNGCP